MMTFKQKMVAISLLAATLVYGGDRAGKPEFFFVPQYSNSQTLHFEGGAKAEVDGGFGLGFGFGYNFSDYLEGGILFSSIRADYTGYYKDENGADQKMRETLYTSGINLIGTYNILRGNITPFISANIGWTYTNTGISNGEYYSSPCYPYYPGYPGYPYYPGGCVFEGTHDDNSFNYGAAIGMRFDFRRGFFMKGSYGINVVDYSSTSDGKYGIFQLTLGSRF
jgi:hypothetical protein